MGRGCASLLPACAVVAALSVTARAQPGDGRLFDAAVPGGLPAALAALDDRASPDRSQFLVEVIRRFHSMPLNVPADPRAAPLRALLAHLDAAAASGRAGATTVPLPLPPQTWIDVVFEGRATPDTLVSAILQSRGASMLYCALLSLDEDTREFLAGRSGLLKVLASEGAARFLVAAPGLRVRQGRMLLPGGEAAKPVWRALADAPADDPETFIRHVVELQRGRLAYFLGAMSRLSPAQIAFALNLDSADADSRVASARSLYAVFERIALQWNLDRLPFWRPAADPAVLLAELPGDAERRPGLPGTRALWHQVFNQSADDSQGPRSGPVDFAWLCEQVFAGIPSERHRRYHLVLFASRILSAGPARSEEDAVDAIRAAARYPALAAALERAGLSDPRAFAAAGRRADRLADIDDDERATRALLQYQGALALISRAALRRGVAPDTLTAAVSSLAAVDLSETGEYEGRLARWLHGWVSGVAMRSSDGESAPDDLDSRVLRLLAGTIPVAREFVEWEGTRYRVDVAAAETARLARLLGEDAPGLLSASLALSTIADGLAGRNVDLPRVRAAATELGPIAAEIGDHLPDAVGRGLREIETTLQGAVGRANTALAASTVPRLRACADDLLAWRLRELAYALALGQPGATSIPVREAARRHDFALGSQGENPAWQLPYGGTWNERPWHVRGSLLGLDVRLSQFALVRISSRPPPRKPSLNEVDRRVFIQAVSLVEPALLSEARHDAILGALRRGRERVAAVRTPSDAAALADEARLSPIRRELLAWTAVHEPGRVATAFSLPELLWLGADASTARGTFDAWGAPGEPRLGCLCLRLDRATWEPVAGRWNTGTLASQFPDLNLRLAELLAELRMPAVLLSPVLAAATLELVENANVRDQDDRRGLSEFVQALGAERVEEYLALLTTDGPLVPVAADASAQRRRE